MLNPSTSTASVRRCVKINLGREDAGGCAANELIPYQNRGRAYVEISPVQGSTTPSPEFYFSARVLLPGGEAYQEVRHSSADEEGRSRADITVPLTHADEVPECVFVTVYNHFLEPVFEKDICAESESRDARADAHAYESFTARLRELPSDPAGETWVSPAGCAHAAPGGARAPGARGSMYVLGLALGAALIVARRTSSR